MTSSTIPATVGSDRAQAARFVVPVAVASTLLAIAMSYIGRNSFGEWLFEIGVALVGAAVIFGVVVRRGLRHQSAGGRALAMGVIGLLLVAPAFWLGLPVQLGAAAVLLGFAGHRASSGSGKSITALVIGALTMITYVSIYVGDYLANH